MQRKIGLASSLLFACARAISTKRLKPKKIKRNYIEPGQNPEVPKTESNFLCVSISMRWKTLTGIGFVLVRCNSVWSSLFSELDLKKFSERFIGQRCKPTQNFQTFVHSFIMEVDDSEVMSVEFSERTDERTNRTKFPIERSLIPLDCAHIKWKSSWVVHFAQRFLVFSFLKHFCAISYRDSFVFSLWYLVRILSLSIQYFRLCIFSVDY